MNLSGNDKNMITGKKYQPVMSVTGLNDQGQYLVTDCIVILFILISEKKDLVELVIRQNCMENGTVPPPPPTSTTTTTTTTADGTSSTNVTQPPLRRKIPEERKKSFPNSYVQSTHRHEWLEKMENGSDMDIALNCDEDDDFVVVTPVQPMNTSEYISKSFAQKNS